MYITFRKWKTKRDDCKWTSKFSGGTGKIKWRGEGDELREHRVDRSSGVDETGWECVKEKIE
jgi:hypothetical protein